MAKASSGQSLGRKQPRHENKPVGFMELVAKAMAAEGRVLNTNRGAEFKVGVYRDCPFFIPLSTGVGRSDGRKAAERFLERYNRTGSLRPVDYQDLTRNASYLVVLVSE